MNSYKKDFPIFKVNPNLVYLDSASTTQKPQVVIDAVTAFYQTTNASIHRGLYPIAEKATMYFENTRANVAKFINARDPSEIIFTHSTTEGINVLAHGLRKQLKKGDAILLTEMEHHSNIVPWQQLAKETGARLLFLTLTKSGELGSTNSIDEIPHVKIVSLTYVSNVLGTINLIKQIFQQLRIHDPKLITIVDAAQAVGHMPIDVQDLDCDFLVFSGHKLFGPTGVGVLYGKKERLEILDPFIVGSQMVLEVTKQKSVWREVPYKFESGTMPIEGVIGFGAAIDYVQKIGMENIQTYEKELITYCLSRMEKIEGITIYGPKEIEKRSGIIAFNLDGIHPHDVAQVLGENTICVRAGHHCAMPLHKVLGTPATVRASFSLYNTSEDIDTLIQGLKKVKTLFS